MPRKPFSLTKNQELLAKAKKRINDEFRAQEYEEIEKLYKKHNALKSKISQRRKKDPEIKKDKKLDLKENAEYLSVEDKEVYMETKLAFNLVDKVKVLQKRIKQQQQQQRENEVKNEDVENNESEPTVLIFDYTHLCEDGEIQEDSKKEDGEIQEDSKKESSVVTNVERPFVNHYCPNEEEKFTTKPHDVIENEQTYVCPQRVVFGHHASELVKDIERYYKEKIEKETKTERSLAENMKVTQGYFWNMKVDSERIQKLKNEKLAQICVLFDLIMYRNGFFHPITNDFKQTQWDQTYRKHKDFMEKANYAWEYVKAGIECNKIDHQKCFSYKSRYN